MRRIIAGLFVTLDGVMEAPEDWQFPYWSDEGGRGGRRAADARRDPAARAADLRDLRRAQAPARRGHRHQRQRHPGPVAAAGPPAGRAAPAGPPIVLGKGARLLQDGDRVPLRLLDSKAFGTGVLSLQYAPADG